MPNGIESAVDVMTPDAVSMPPLGFMLSVCGIETSPSGTLESCMTIGVPDAGANVSVKLPDFIGSGNENCTGSSVPVGFVAKSSADVGLSSVGGSVVVTATAIS